MSERNIDNLFEIIESTANSVKVLVDNNLPQVKHILEGNSSIEGSPSRASAAHDILRVIKGRTDELLELLAQLEKEIISNYSDMK